MVSLIAVEVALASGCSREDLVERSVRDNQAWAAKERKTTLESRVAAEKTAWLRERLALREREDRIAAEGERIRREADSNAVWVAQAAVRRVAELVERDEEREEDLRYFALKEVPGLWQELKGLKERIRLLDGRLAGLRGTPAAKQEKDIAEWNRLKRGAQGTEVALERAFKADWLYQNRGGLEEYAAVRKKAFEEAATAVRVSTGAGAGDTRTSQLKIARSLAANDSKVLREKARRLLVDEEAILSLVCSPREREADLAEWAVGLELPQKALEEAVGRAATQETAFGLLARLETPQALERIAKGYVPGAVRAAAASRLGGESEGTLLTLARDKNAGVREVALSVLDRIAPDSSRAIRQEYSAAERAEEERRQATLRERNAQDKRDCEAAEEASRIRLDHDLQWLWLDLQVQADIRTCRDWGRLQESGTRVKKRMVKFSGTVTKVATHWFRADEVWVDVDCRGDRYAVHAKIAEWDKAVPGNRVQVAGLFVEGDAMLVHLKKASVRTR